MIRRSFRIGLTLGLLGGLGWALAKMFGPIRSSSSSVPSESTPWPVLISDQPAASPAAERLATPPVVTPNAPQAPAATAPAPAAPPPVKAAAAKAAPSKTTAPRAAAPAKPKAAAKSSAAKAKAPTKKKPLVAAWVAPEGNVCPTTHPVKGKVTSKIFHLPGMLNYVRTKPDRCYRDADAAEADGLRPAKR